MAWGSTIIWSLRHSGRQTAVGRVSADMTDEQHGWLRLQLGELDQRINLVAHERHFGGRQWYFVCPATGRRASVIWRPPGARQFASRQAWGGRVAYGSQFETWHDRALSGTQEIRYRLAGKDYISVLDGMPPPKPKGMHWKTYQQKIKRCEAYEGLCFSTLSSFC